MYPFHRIAYTHVFLQKMCRAFAEQTPAENIQAMTPKRELPFAYAAKLQLSS